MPTHPDGWACGAPASSAPSYGWLSHPPGAFGHRCGPWQVPASAGPRQGRAEHRAGVKASGEGRPSRQARSLERFRGLDRGCKLDLRSVGDSPSCRFDSRASASFPFFLSRAARLPVLTYARRCLGLGHGGIGGCPPHLRLGNGPPASMPNGLRQDSDGRRSR
jgi:hypothetical protein